MNDETSTNVEDTPEEDTNTEEEMEHTGQSPANNDTPKRYFLCWVYGKNPFDNAG